MGGYPINLVTNILTLLATAQRLDKIPEADIYRVYNEVDQLQRFVTGSGDFPRTPEGCPSGGMELSLAKTLLVFFDRLAEGGYLEDLPFSEIRSLMKDLVGTVDHLLLGEDHITKYCHRSSHTQKMVGMLQRHLVSLASKEDTLDWTTKQVARQSRAHVTKINVRCASCSTIRDCHCSPPVPAHLLTECNLESTPRKDEEAANKAANHGSSLIVILVASVFFYLI